MAVKIIPKQKEGGRSNDLCSIKGISNQQAVHLFQLASNRLLDINNWKNICEEFLKANFTLCDDLNKEITKLVKRYDYFKIDIPGPGPAAGEGYDWVQNEHISRFLDKINDTDLFSITVNLRPVRKLTKQP